MESDGQHVMMTGMTHILAVSGGGDWLLPAMILIPILSGLALAWTPRESGDIARGIAMGVSLLMAAMGVMLAIAFNWGAGAEATDLAGLQQFSVNVPWMSSIGLSLRLGIDAVSLWLILLAVVLGPLAILGTWHDVKDRGREFYLWLLVLSGSLVGVFAATDVILFYVFFEMTLIPLFFLIGIFGSGNRHYAAIKYVVFTLAGSLLTLGGLVYVAYVNAAETGRWTFYIPQLVEAARAMNPTQQGWVLLSLLIGFGIKLPLVPLHTWQAMTYAEAPTAGVVMLAGAAKLGGYGLYRFVLPMVPAGVAEYGQAIAVLAIVGILYAALICWVQTDLKRLLAYSSLSHMGFVALGLVAVNDAGVGGSVFYLVNHGLSTAGLFLCVGMLESRFGTREMDQLTGMGRRMPVWSTFMVIFALASVGLPGLNGFVGEFLTLLGTFAAAGWLGPWYAATAGLGLILAAIYVLYMLGRVVMGPGRAGRESRAVDLNLREIGTLAPLAAACVAMGLFPTVMLRSIEPSVKLTAAGARTELSQRPAAVVLVPDDREPAAAAAVVRTQEVVR
jgi:NADH-quinone oxidoreductase subunit M